MSKILSLPILALSASLAFANQLELNGQINVKIPVKDQDGANKTLKVKLPRYKLSEQVLKKIKNKLKHHPAYVYKSQTPKFALELPPKIELGMEGTPVLNQGMHGSCVIFATSAAIDAALGAGDYISQLCGLELGATLAINNEIPFSGWNGSFGDIVLQQFMKYGIVSKNYQKNHGCAGVTKYPVYEETNEGHPMDVMDYTKVSVPLKDIIQWDVLMNDFDLKPTHYDNVFDPVWIAKEELAKGHRLSVGMLLDINYGVAGAVGTHKAPYDTWMITPEIIIDVLNGDIRAGHELVVTGYDDNVVVFDDEGNANKGVFKVRNSWSQFAGDKGNFYISYDHFYIFVGEIHATYLKK